MRNFKMKFEESNRISAQSVLLKSHKEELLRGLERMATAGSEELSDKELEGLSGLEVFDKDMLKMLIE